MNISNKKVSYVGIMTSKPVLETNLSLPIFRRGKVRDVYLNGDYLLIVSTDRISAFDVNMKNGIPSKGESLTELSIYWFRHTSGIFPNHFLRQIDSRSIEVIKAERIDIEWVARRYLYGSAWRRYNAGERILGGVKLPNGLEMAEELPETILTPTTKAETGHDLPLVKREAITNNFVTVEEWRELEEATFRLYESYMDKAKSKGILIPDFKLEFGKSEDGLIQIDEPPTHDSARFWSEKNYAKGKQQESHALDKEFLRQYLIRIGFSGDGESPLLPPLVVEEISKRCIGSSKVLSGKGKIEDLELRSVNQIILELGIT